MGSAVQLAATSVEFSLPRIMVVILAGGQSSRMGENKALLRDAVRKGDRLLTNACRLAEHLLAELGQDQTAVAVSGSYPGRNCIRDIIPGAGPLSGMHAALTAVLAMRRTYQYLLFIPVDMPALSVARLRQLVQSASTARAVHFRGFELPAMVAVDREIENLLAKRLSETPENRISRSVRNFLQALSPLTIEIPQASADEFMNINTPTDFRQWCEGEEK